MKKANQVEPALNFNQQCLRILRCTAKALVSSPGGLRFQPGTQPWLEGLQGIGCIQLMAESESPKKLPRPRGFFSPNLI